MKQFRKDFTQDYYRGLKGIYFRKILRTIVRLGELDIRDVRVLDFGCGIGKLSKLLPGKVIGYDVLENLSEISDWKSEKFDIVVANEVFEYLNRDELINFLEELLDINDNVNLIAGISRANIINNTLACLSGEFDSHADSLLGPREQKKILTDRMEIIKTENVLWLCDVYVMRFKVSKEI